jgi:hypothetical protein
LPDFSRQKPNPVCGIGALLTDRAMNCKSFGQYTSIRRQDESVSAPTVGLLAYIIIPGMKIYAKETPRKDNSNANSIFFI